MAAHCHKSGLSGSFGSREFIHQAVDLELPSSTGSVLKPGVL
jgi:hypothetical protein